MIGIYKIQNRQTGQVYIGQSMDIEQRLAEHKQKRTQTIDNYINCLGVDNFNFEILEECSKEELDIKEQEYIQRYNSIKEGYNLQAGGNNNSSGESNGRAIFTEADIYFIRQCYANHCSAKKIYETYFKDRINKKTFQAAWQGLTWKYIMPEVYTLENKRYYISEQCKIKELLTPNEVFQYRKYYINHTRKEVYTKFCEEHGFSLKQATFYKILTGDVRPESLYKQIPVYKKSKKVWELNGEPVSTIPESWE